MENENQSHELTAKKGKGGSGELLVLMPFFIFSALIFFGSFNYKFEARAVPMFIGLVTMLLSGARVLSILRGRSTKEMVGIGGDFDKIKDDLRTEFLEGRIQEEKKRITWRDEVRGYVLLVMNFLSIFLFGFWIGIFLGFIGSARLYRFKQYKSIFWMILSAYLFVYVICYRLMGFPLYKGVVLEWIWR